MPRTRCILLLLFTWLCSSVFVRAAEGTFPGAKSDFGGFERYDFSFDGKPAIVVVPKQAAEGKPWIWRARFFGHKPEVDLALLEKGFHLVHLDTANLFGGPEAMTRWSKFYDFLVNEHGLAKKAALEGLSRGGLFVFNWASENPDKVACIYADAPVCDIKSWPFGMGQGSGSPTVEEDCLKAWGITREQLAEFKGNPIDRLEPIAKAGIPIFCVCGGADEVVPINENTRILEQRFLALGGRIQVIVKPNCGHHPHGLEDPTPIIDFILKETAAALEAKRKPTEFKSVFPTGVSRHWPGPDYFGNRLFDWQVRNGCLECICGEKDRPVRTMHLLSGYAAEAEAGYRVSVFTGPILSEDKKAPPVEAAPEEEPKRFDGGPCVGFLIGVGGPGIDYRISALCHQWPRPDGGLLAGVDRFGRVFFADNNAQGRRLFQTTNRQGPGFDKTMPQAMRLELDVLPDGPLYRVSLGVFDAKTGALINRAVIGGVEPSLVDGNMALVSSGSPAENGKGFWFVDWNVTGDKIVFDESRRFGPVWAVHYTLSRGILKLTAQMPALGEGDTAEGRLEFQDAQGNWTAAATSNWQPHSFILPFRVEDYAADRDVPYRVVYDLKSGPEGATTAYTYEGTIRKEPLDKNELVIGSLSCEHISAAGADQWNEMGYWFPHAEVADAVKKHDPDFLFFAGDQIYESGLAGIVRTPAETSCLDYLYHWLCHCWSFRDVTKDRPTVCTPDDHDVYHGNLWGAGGRDAYEGPFKRPQDNGGYVQPPLMVNAVHATQTSHLPDPVDPEPIEQGITVYFTDLVYGGVSFAIISDRMFKSSPSVMCEGGECVNGWFLDPDYDPAKQADVPGAVLLGERQLRFLEEWAHDWSSHAQLKVLLSQTLFCNLATLPNEANNDSVVPTMRIPEADEVIKTDKIVADADSNGWPQTPRNNALRVIRKGFAVHLAGDQHLASTVQYGIDEHGDGPFAICSPAIACCWPRRWWPPAPGENRLPGAPEYTGEFLDAFGNRITVHAVANPRQSRQEPKAMYERVPGYSIVRLDKKTRKITFENWPRGVDPAVDGAKPWSDWPVTCDQRDNYGRKAAAWLPALSIRGLDMPVVQVVNEATGERIYSIRLKKGETTFRPKVFEDGTYTVKVFDPDAGKEKTLAGLESKTEDDRSALDVVFE